MILTSAGMIRSLFRVTAWERESLARRLLCAFGRVSILVAILAAIANSIFAHQHQIEARVWHWRHGYTNTIGGYSIPGPNHWFIDNEDSDSFTMVNLSPTHLARDGKFHTVAVVTVMSVLRGHWQGASSMDIWLSLQHKRLAAEKPDFITEKTLKFEEESITCIGGNELNAMMRNAKPTDKPSHLLETDAVFLDCMSDNGLELMFVGEPSDVLSFYGLVSQIRRKS
jgi:hypothetical protein